MIGHWLTPTGPSAQLLPAWNIPCQCWDLVVNMSLLEVLKKTYNAGAEEHAGVGQLVDDIEKEGISLWRIVVRSSP